MEDHKLGKRCSLAECRQIDWMPISCKYCSQVFCADHYGIDSHHCEAVSKHFNKVMLCPFCELPVKIDTNMSP
jgi:predicted nucleic acid binding AN1-type Zn finger protein